MGEGYLGSLGQGDFEAREEGFVPLPMLDDYEIKDFSAGWAHSAVVTRCGKLFIFGRPHDIKKSLNLRHQWKTFPLLVKLNQAMKGPLDSPSSTSASYWKEDVWLLPREVPLPDGEKAKQVSCSGALTAVVTEGGRVACMGGNHFGQCGVGTVSSNVWLPTLVNGLEGEEIEEVRAGFQHLVCRSSSSKGGGRGLAWGKGERGQLGNGAEVNHPSAFPIDIPIEETGPIIKVASGFNHSVALTSEGKVWVWGKMQGLGIKEESRGVTVHEDQLLPREIVLEGQRVIDIACGHFHTSLLITSEESSVVSSSGSKREKEEIGMMMFGMKAQSRRMEVRPTSISLPSSSSTGDRIATATATGNAGGSKSMWSLSGAMASTVLLNQATGEAYTAEFDGEATQFIPVQNAVLNDEGEGQQQGSTALPDRIHGLSTGLAHRLALLSSS